MGAIPVLDVAAEAKMDKVLLPFKPNPAIPYFSRFKHFPSFLEPNITIQESSNPFQKCLKHLAKANNQGPPAAAVTPLHHMTHPTQAKI